MKYLLYINLLLVSCTNNNNPYDEGMHWDYSIFCENGFKYKSMDHHRGTILLLNSDGTPLKCNAKKY